MRRPKSGSFQKRLPVGDSNGGRIDGASVCTEGPYCECVYVGVGVCSSIIVQYHHSGNFLIAHEDSKPRPYGLLVTANFVPSSPILVTLMKEALSSSETSLLTRATRRNIPEDPIILNLWPSSGEERETSAPLGPLKRANWTIGKRPQLLCSCASVLIVQLVTGAPYATGHVTKLRGSRLLTGHHSVS
jgi:hypothetical protein